MGLIYIFLGFGLLVLFTLIGAQIVLVVAGFYVVSLLALLFIPLGAFSPVKNLFEAAIAGVIKMGARVFALILVIGVAVNIWSQFDIGTISTTTTLDKPLGLLFSALVVFVLALKIPTFAADLVGHLGGSLFEPGSSQSSGASATPSVHTTITSTGDGGGGTLSNLAAASSLTSTSAGGIGMQASGNLASATSTVTSAGSGKESGGIQSTQPLMGQQPGKVAGGSSISRGISNKTLNQLKATFKQAMRENDKKSK